MKNYFALKEQQCSCCGTGKFAPDFLDKLNQAREIAGIPFVINSGFRCLKHNKEVGGKENSSHLVGCAADIRVQSGWERFVIVDALLKAGINRIGIADTFIHCDTDFTKPQEVIWTY